MDLRDIQAISCEHLRQLFQELFGLTIGEGALANLFWRVQRHLEARTEAIRARVRASRVVCADETSACEEGHRWGAWVFAGPDAVLPVLVPSRAQRVP